MKTITGTTKVWFSGDYYGPDDIKRDGSVCVGKLSYCDNDMTPHGWTLIGTAEITLSLIDDDKMIENKVASLRAEIQIERATSQMKVTQLENSIQQLLAITNEVRS